MASPIKNPEIPNPIATGLLLKILDKVESKLFRGINLDF